MSLLIVCTGLDNSILRLRPVVSNSTNMNSTIMGLSILTEKGQNYSRYLGNIASLPENSSHNVIS